LLNLEWVLEWSEGQVESFEMWLVMTSGSQVVSINGIWGYGSGLDSVGVET